MTGVYRPVPSEQQKPGWEADLSPKKTVLHGSAISGHKSRRQRWQSGYRYLKVAALPSSFSHNDFFTGGFSMTETTNTAKTEPCPTFKRTIGKTTYLVRVHFSETSKETMEDKIKRLLREEVRRM